MEIGQRFVLLLSLIKERYQAAGYELDDVHLAQILGIHDGVLRKGKKNSVSPALALATGRVWGIDLNWLLLGEGEPPGSQGPPYGIERLPSEKRIARGRLNEQMVRRLLSEKGLSQKKLAKFLGTSLSSTGSLVRGQLRDPRLRIRLAEILQVDPDSLFLTSRASAGTSPASLTLARTRAKKPPIYSLQTIRSALETMLTESLEPSLAAHSALPGEGTEYEDLEVRIDVPPAPEGLTGNDRKRYERNRRVLEHWSRTPGAFEVPPEVAGLYCLKVSGFYNGGRLDDVGGLLREFLEGYSELCDKAPGVDSERLKLKKGVLTIGNIEIEVDNPELLAKLPEYLSSEIGRKRLLKWLRDNLKDD
ncbi:MAG: helix-turn-helix transcriptional regulator [Gemmatimonadota bacterium]|nr:helix-turn-helix transcriptional regulator [Gemmatimonadota bacterium]